MGELKPSISTDSLLKHSLDVLRENLLIILMETPPTIVSTTSEFAPIAKTSGTVNPSMVKPVNTKGYIGIREITDGEL